MGTGGVEIWVWGPESVIFTEGYWYDCLCFYVVMVRNGPNNLVCVSPLSSLCLLVLVS